MAILYFLRHGKTKENELFLVQGRIDYPLSPLGIREVELSAKYFKSNPSFSFDLILSSPLKRAISSGEIFKDTFKYNGDIIVRDNLIEREFGEYEGKPLSDKFYKDVYNGNIKGFEDNDSLTLRVVKEIEEIVKLYPDKKILIATHSHLIKAFLSHLNPKYKFSDKIRNASITTISYNNKKFKVERVDELGE
ncbi:MAG: histidine phosphatase family protein [Gammaproteobacteria bacterium]|nr:histidine phosphatase family protein [Gammaproteobacteria bacterium]